MDGSWSGLAVVALQRGNTLAHQAQPTLSSAHGNHLPTMIGDQELGEFTVGGVCCCGLLYGHLTRFSVVDLAPKKVTATPCSSRSDLLWWFQCSLWSSETSTPNVAAERALQSWLGILIMFLLVVYHYVTAGAVGSRAPWGKEKHDECGIQH
jgi:hypothetical protein